MNYLILFFLFLFVPILVHLFSFRKARKLLFSNVKFIQRITNQTKSKTRLKHILILTTRILAFIFILITFLSPFLGSADKGTDKLNSKEYFYLDNSLSSFQNGEVLQTDLIERLVTIDELSGGFLLTNDFSPFSNNERTRPEILDELSTVRVSYVDRSLSEVLNRASEAKNINLVSDFQSASINDYQRIKEDTLRKYNLIFQESSLNSNIYVDSVWIERDVNDYDKINLNCILGYSKDLIEGSYIVKLLDQNSNQVSSLLVNIENTSKATFTIPIRRNTYQYKIVLSGDEVEYDNEFYLSIEGSEIPSVLILDGSKNKYLSNVFANNELFDLTVSDKVDYESINSMDLVVLNEYFNLPNGLVKQNKDQLSFMIVPADSINISNYSAEAGIIFRSNDSNELVEISANIGNDILTDIFSTFDQNMNMPVANSVFQPAGVYDEILNLRDGDVLLAKDIESSVYYFTSPLREEYTDLPNHSIFLPIMYKIANRSVSIDQHIFHYPGTNAKVSSIPSEQPPKFVSDDIEIVLEVNRSAETTRLPTHLPPGFYYAVQGSDTLSSFGLNLPKSESTSDGLTLNEVKAFFNDSPHVQVMSVDSDNEVLANIGGENDLWKYALILALVFVLIETMLHRILR